MLVALSSSNPVQYDPRFGAQDFPWLAKRVVGLENDVIRTGKLGKTSTAHFVFLQLQADRLAECKDGCSSLVNTVVLK